MLVGFERTGRARGARGKRRGAALVLSLVAVSVIAGLGATLIQVQSMMARKQSFSIDRRRALYIAEAGIAEASLAVSQGKSGIIATEDVPARFGNGVYWVESTDLPDDRVALVCTARAGTAEFMLRTIVLPNLNPVASLGIFGADGVEVGWGTVADGFHSGYGEFDDQIDITRPGGTTGRGLRMRSNADIALVESIGGELTDPLLGSGELGGASSGDGESGWGAIVLGEGSGGPAADPGTGGGGALLPPPGDPTRIFGRLSPGPEGSVRSNGFSEVKGRVTPSRYPTALPAVTYPDVQETLSGDQLVVGTWTDVGSATDTRVLGDVVVGKGATLRLTGPKTLDVQRLILAPEARLELDDDAGPIEIYTREGFLWPVGATVESLGLHQDARGTSVFVGESPGGALGRVEIGCDGTFHGVLYAPSDDVRIPSSLRFLGSLAARLVRIEGGAHVSYDRRLAIGGSGVPTLPRLLSWQIVPLGEGTARQLSIDPLLELALRGVTPVASGDGAPETTLEIQYVTPSGGNATYTGAFTGFDPTNATRIVAVRWDDPRGGPPRSWLRPAGDDPTDAVAEDRTVDRTLRTVIRRLTADTRVGYLTVDETVDLISSLPNEALDLENVKVRAADDRVGGGVARDVNDALVTFDFDVWMDDVTTKDDAGADGTVIDVDGTLGIDGALVVPGG